MSNFVNKPVCKRCLLREMDKDKYFENIYEYISLIPEEIKTEDSIYKIRLNTCKSCDFLTDGMCGKCGCFVEVRAAKATNYCPHEKPRW